MRNRLVHAVEAAGIQTRMLFAGNLVRHPCFDEMRREGTGFRVAVPLTQTDRAVDNTFWIGVYPGLSQENIEYIIERFLEFTKA